MRVAMPSRFRKDGVEKGIVEACSAGPRARIGRDIIRIQQLVNVINTDRVASRASIGQTNRHLTWLSGARGFDGLAGEGV